MDFPEAIFPHYRPLMPFVLTAGIFFLLPSIIAAVRRHNSTGAIMVVNLLFGWSILGWIWALIWSFTGNVASNFGLGSTAPRRPYAFALIIGMLIILVVAVSNMNLDTLAKNQTRAALMPSAIAINAAGASTPSCASASERCNGPTNQAANNSGHGDNDANSVAKKIAPRPGVAKLATTQDSANRAVTSNWTYAISKDAITQKQMWVATVTSNNQVSLSFPYQGEQAATLELRRHPQYGKDVILHLDRGQILCGLQGCSVLVRFDNQPAEHFGAAPAADNSTNVIFIRNFKRFVQKAVKAKSVAIQVSFFQNGDQTFDFDVAGLKLAEK